MQGGGGPSAGLVEKTSDPFAPRRVVAFSRRGGGSAVPEPRHVASIRPRAAGAVEARATRVEKKTRRRKPQIWHCQTYQVDCTSEKNMLALKATSCHQRKAAEIAGTPYCATCDRKFQLAGHLATHMQSRRHASPAARISFCWSLEQGALMV